MSKAGSCLCLGRREIYPIDKGEGMRVRKAKDEIIVEMSEMCLRALQLCARSLSSAVPTHYDFSFSLPCKCSGLLLQCYSIQSTVSEIRDVRLEDSPVTQHHTSSTTQPGLHKTHRRGEHETEQTPRQARLTNTLIL